MKRLSLAIVVFCGAAAVAIAAGDPIKERQSLMKGNGDAMKVVMPMLKGEKPYDAKAAAEAMKSIAGSLDKFVTLFPAGSETGGDTAAKPEIWTSKNDFDALAKATKEGAAKAETAAAGGLDSLKTAMGAVGKGCKGCHEKYRTEKN
jgi:cytochrome c556